jgi:hypothetical protein
MRRAGSEGGNSKVCLLPLRLFVWHAAAPQTLQSGVAASACVQFLPRWIRNMLGVEGQSEVVGVCWCGIRARLL